MKKIFKELAIPIIIIMVVNILVITNINKDKTQYNANISRDTVYVVKYTNFSDELGIIKKDLKTYNRFSPKLINNMVLTIKKASNKYNIPVGLLHAIFRIESEYRFWIEHPAITVKGKKAKAVGLGGVVWGYWSDSLKTHGIADTRADLFIYQNNIYASAAILRWLSISIIKNNPNINSNEMIKEIIKRYYGAYSNQYYKKISKVTSDLWLKRIGKIIKQNVKAVTDSLYGGKRVKIHNKI